MDRNDEPFRPAPTGWDAGSSADLGGFGLDLPDDDWLDRVRAAERSIDAGVIGPYEIVEEISRGAQGVVYRARQTGTRRDIALKRLVAGRFATPAARARFTRETEAAAALSHPNIVTVYGTELVGDQPVLAMEWIDGPPIDQWARSLGAGDVDAVRSLLETFLRVCDAVQHAHQRGVIHRDLKPSNILVDSQGRPHVVDFGLAKVLSVDDSAAANLTLTQDFVGTPAYAAPEQARSDHAAVDVRTDVYALGAILYEMLTGRTAHTGTLHALLDAIQKEEPAPPSTLKPGLGRELDAIALKALAKDPGRRYQSVDALADDVRRYLDGDAVSAHPPSAAYQLRKLVRRHRLPFAFAGGLVLLLIAFGVVASVMALRLEAQRQAALAARNDEAEARAASEEITRFLQDALAAADPSRSKGREVTVRELVDAAAERVGHDLTGRPRVEAAVRVTLGKTYYNLGLRDEADGQFLRALELLDGLHPNGHKDSVETLNWLGNVRQAQGRFDDAIAFYQDALGMQRAVGAGPEDVARTLQNLAVAHIQQNELTDAEHLLTEARELLAGMPDVNEKQIVHSELGLSSLYFHQGRWADAEAILYGTVERARRAHGEHHEVTITALNNLALTLKKQQKLAEAKPLYDASLAASESTYGPEHPLTLNAMGNVASLVQAMGNHVEAHALYLETIEAQRRVLGADHPDVISTLHNLATLAQVRERYDEAEAYFREALAAAERVHGPDKPETATIGASLGALLLKLNRGAESLREAEPLLLDAMTVFASIYPPDHAFCVKTLERIEALYGPEALNDPAAMERVKATYAPAPE